jgi:hypothetical protein
VSTVFALIVGVALTVIVPTIVVLVVQERVRRQAAARLRRRDPVEAAYSDAVGIALAPDAVEVARLRALAAADGAEAAFVSPGHARVEAFLVEVLGRRSS